MNKTAQAFRTISEVSDELDVPKHVLRFWELKFPQIKPMKRGGGRRYYRPEDIELLNGIRYLLHAEAYTIKGVQKILRERGVEAVKAAPVAGSGRSAAAASSTSPSGARKPSRRATGAAKSAANSLAKARSEPPALPPGAAKAVEQAIAELRACRQMLSKSAPASSASTSRPKPAAARPARRQA